MEKTVVEGKLLEDVSALGDSLLYHVQTKEQDIKKKDKELFSQTHLNVDDPGIKTEEDDAFLSKNKFRLF